MKIRNGFVSNSSSSSFVIAGYELTNILDLDMIEDDERWMLQNFFVDNSLLYYVFDEELQVRTELLGLELDKMEMHETLKGFITRATGEVNKMLQELYANTPDEFKDKLKQENEVEKEVTGMFVVLTDMGGDTSWEIVKMLSEDESN